MAQSMGRCEEVGIQAEYMAGVRVFGSLHGAMDGYSFLCGMAKDWCGRGFVVRLRPGEALGHFFSYDMYHVLRFLRYVTCSMEESGRSTIVSIEENDDAISRGAAYGSDELRYGFREYESYNFEIDSLWSSYPARKVRHFGRNNRDVAVAGLADTVGLAKNLGVDILSTMRRCFD